RCYISPQGCPAYSNQPSAMGMANRRPAAPWEECTTGCACLTGSGTPAYHPVIVLRGVGPCDLEIPSWRRRGCRRHVFVGERSKDCACGDADAHQDCACLASCELHSSPQVSGQIIRANCRAPIAGENSYLPRTFYELRLPEARPAPTLAGSSA